MLLNALAGRPLDGKLEGKLLMNGVPRNEAKILFKYQSYVLQDDVLMVSKIIVLFFNVYNIRDHKHHLKLFLFLQH